MGRPLMGYNLKPKNSFTGLLHPDVVGWMVGGRYTLMLWVYKRWGKKDKRILPKKVHLRTPNAVPFLTSLGTQCGTLSLGSFFRVSRRPSRGWSCTRTGEFRAYWGWISWWLRSPRGPGPSWSTQLPEMEVPNLLVKYLTAKFDWVSNQILIEYIICIF